jgi:hypothetical protein
MKNTNNLCALFQKSLKTTYLIFLLCATPLWALGEKVFLYDEELSIPLSLKMIAEKYVVAVDSTGKVTTHELFLEQNGSNVHVRAVLPPLTSSSRRIYPWLIGIGGESWTAGDRTGACSEVSVPSSNENDITAKKEESATSSQCTMQSYVVELLAAEVESLTKSVLQIETDQASAELLSREAELADSLKNFIEGKNLQLSLPKKVGTDQAVPAQPTQQNQPSEDELIEEQELAEWGVM